MPVDQYAQWENIWRVLRYMAQYVPLLNISLEILKDISLYVSLDTEPMDDGVVCHTVQGY